MSANSVASWTRDALTTLGCARGGDALERACQLSLPWASLPAALVEEANMEIVHERAAGLDVHKGSVVARVRGISGGQGEAGASNFRYDDRRARSPAGLADFL